MRLITIFATLMIASTGSLFAHAQTTPWGTAAAQESNYTPQKVVYDVSLSTPEEFDIILDRLSGLSVEYGADPFDASIIAVLHGPEMSFFDIREFDKYEELVRRAQSMTVGGVIELRMCQRAASNRGIEPEHVHGFIQLVTMGDAEIARLQQEEGYAYMK